MMLAKKVSLPLEKQGTRFGKRQNRFPMLSFVYMRYGCLTLAVQRKSFALASCMITHGTVIRTVTIRPSSSSTTKKSKIKAAIEKLKELPKCHNCFHIRCSDEALVEPSLW